MNVESPQQQLTSNTPSPIYTTAQVWIVGAKTQLIGWTIIGMAGFAPLQLLLKILGNSLLVLPIITVWLLLVAILTGLVVYGFLKRYEMPNTKKIAVVGTVTLAVPILGLVSYLLAVVILVGGKSLGGMPRL